MCLRYPNSVGRPESFRDEIIMNVYDDARLANLSPEIAHELIVSKNMTTENDWLVAINEAETRAKEIGLAQGIQQGREEGIQQGIQQGIQEGAESKARETAANLKASGVPLDVIASCTGWSMEEVTAL